MSYIHIETLCAEDDNNYDYKQFKLQKAKLARPTLHTHIHEHKPDQATEII